MAPGATANILFDWVIGPLFCFNFFRIGWTDASVKEYENIPIARVYQGIGNLAIRLNTTPINRCICPGSCRGHPQK